MDTQDLAPHVDRLACPETRQSLTLLPLAAAEARMGGALSAARHPKAGEAQPVGATPNVLVTEDDQRAYPVLDGIPILVVPEMLATGALERTFDLSDPRYEEAYEEMEFYNRVATSEAEKIEESESYRRIVGPVLRASASDRAGFPEPRHVWIDAIYDCAAQWDSYSHIAPLPGKRVLQLGGRGDHAVKFLLGGASEAWVATPMLGEARFARALATRAGVAPSLVCVVGLAEESPFADETFDAIYSGGCVHHMVTPVALPEAARILKRGGDFAASDPWRTPFHHVGTKLLGKREAVHCRPLTRARVAPLGQAFPSSETIQHGALTRHLLLALDKFGLASSLPISWHLNRIDDAFCSLIPGLRRLGSSVVLLGVKKAG